MISFSLAVFFLIITPGPGVLSTAGIGASFGYSVGLRYLTGLFIGTNLVALAVVTGLAAILFSIPWLRNVLLVISVVYLLYLASRIAFFGSKIAFIEARKKPGLIDGILLQIINPKAYAVNTTLFSGFAFMASNQTAEIAIKFLIINAIWIPIHIGWLAAGVSLKQLAIRPSIQRAINIVMALSLIAVVGFALWAMAAHQGS